MALDIDEEGNFFDDLINTGGGSTGITYSAPEVAPGNEGEIEAQAFNYWDAIKAAASFLPESAQSLASMAFSDPRADSVSQSQEASRAAAASTVPEQSNTGNVIDRLLGGLKDAYAKDPKEFLKLGLGALGGAYTEDQKRKAADAAARARLEEQANAAALEQAKKKAYTDSLRGIKPGAPKQQKPLSRIDGTPIYTNGVIKG